MISKTIFLFFALLTLTTAQSVKRAPKLNTGFLLQPTTATSMDIAKKHIHGAIYRKLLKRDYKKVGGRFAALNPKSHAELLAWSMKPLPAYLRTTKVSRGSASNEYYAQFLYKLLLGGDRRVYQIISGTKKHLQNLRIRKFETRGTCLSGYMGFGFTQDLAKIKCTEKKIAFKLALKVNAVKRSKKVAKKAPRLIAKKIVVSKGQAKVTVKTNKTNKKRFLMLRRSKKRVPGSSRKMLMLRRSKKRVPGSARRNGKKF